MKEKLLGSAALVLVLMASAACEKRTQTDATGQTRTTSAQTDRDSIGDDLRQAGQEVGSAAEKAGKKIEAVAEKTAEEVKEGTRNLDVKVGEPAPCDPGQGAKARACDGGGATARER